MSRSVPTPKPEPTPPDPPAWQIFVLPVVIVVLAAIIRACS